MTMISNRMKMKRFVCYIATMAFLFSGCSKEFIDFTEQAPRNEPLIFKATYVEKDNTRTVMDADQNGVLWSADDRINIFGAEGEMREYCASGAGPTTDFSSSGSETMSELEEGEEYFALYPYDENATIADGEITTTLKNEYTVSRANTFVDGMNIAVAKSPTTNLSFKNVLSWLRVGSSGLKDVERIEFRGNNNEVVAGQIVIDYSGDLPVATVVEGTGSTVMTINVENFEESVNDMEHKENMTFYYIPVLPGNYSKGVTLTFISGGVSRTHVINKELTFNRSKKKATFADLTANVYKRVESVEDIDEVTNGKYLLVYPSGSSYYAFSFQKAMENVVAEANRLSNVHSLDELKNQATTVYQNVLKTNYVTATSTDNGATITIDNSDDEEGAVIVANGGYENAETTLSAEVDGKAFTLRLEKITADLQANNSVLMSAVFNGEDLVNMANALRGHNITLTLGNCIDYVGPKCGMDANQIATAKRFFTEMCTLVAEYTGKPFNVTLSTTVTDFYNQYWDNIRDYALQFGGDKHWGAAYPFGFYKADDGFTFNIPTPNKVWFDNFEESTSRTIDDFVAYWSAKDGYHNFPFKKLAEKFAEKLDEETFQAIKKLNFSSLGNTYQRWVDRFNDTLEEVYLYKLDEE